MPDFEERTVGSDEADPEPQSYPGGVRDPLAAHLGRLEDCVRGTLAANGRATCCGGIIPGQEPVWDHCGDGFCDAVCAGTHYVQVRRIFTAEAFPFETTLTSARCAHQMVAEIAVGVVRCVPSVREDGTPPRAEDQEESAGGLLYDAQLMRTAILCCWMSEHPTEGPDTDEVSIGAWVPQGPQGGCAAGEWTVRVVMGSCPCTPEVELTADQIPNRC